MYSFACFTSSTELSLRLYQYAVQATSTGISLLRANDFPRLVLTYRASTNVKSPVFFIFLITPWEVPTKNESNFFLINYTMAARKLGNGVISLLWQLWCHCNPDHN